MVQQANPNVAPEAANEQGDEVGGDQPTVPKEAT
jgi:hypothetical protein